LNRNAVFPTQRTVETMQEQANKVMDALFSLNNTNKSTVPWLDCARSYGLSEQFVGDYLRRKNIGPRDVYVSSKWGYTYVADFQVSLAQGEPHEVKDHSTENFLKQLKETEALIGDYVDLYQIHSATFESGILTDTKAHKALADTKKARGWKMGLSVSSPRQGDVIRKAMEITVDKTRLFDSVQCTWNLLEQSASEALLELHEAGWDIIIKEGLANGRVLRNPHVQDCAKQLGCAPDQLALAAILAQPFAPRVLSGAVTSEQLESNWKAQEIVDQLQADNGRLLEEIMGQCRMKSEDYWAERSALAWN